MIQLVAFSPGDGWGLVRQSDAWWLIQPPYKAGSRTPLSDTDAGHLLWDGFGALIEREFANWGEATRWMSAERLRHAESQRAPPSAEDAARIFDFAGDDEILTHFATIASWIRDGDRAAAHRAVTAIMNSSVVRGTAVRDEAARLLRIAEVRPPPQSRADAGYRVRDENRLARDIAAVRAIGTLSFGASAAHD